MFNINVKKPEKITVEITANFEEFDILIDSLFDMLSNVDPIEVLDIDKVKNFADELHEQLRG